MLPQLALGFGLALLIGLIAYWRGSLSRSGVVGAVLIGTTIFGFGGWAWGLLLIAFFVSSSALSHFNESRKATLAEKFSKGHQRDLAQTLANGGLAALLVAYNALSLNPFIWIAFVGALATVTADTWATELGVLSDRRPRLITTFKTVEPGTSGGLTIVGTLAALGGGVFIGLLAALLWWLGWVTMTINTPTISLMMISGAGLGVPLAGLLGSLFDSWLGALVQAMYYCDACRTETERYPTHTCGQPTRFMRGWAWLNNDWVNFISSIVGAILAVLFAMVIGAITVLFLP